VREAFLKGGFTGYRTEPAIVSKVKRKSKRVSEIPRLYELEVYGSGGPPDPSSGSSPLTEPDGNGFMMYSSYKNGFIVNESTWDGSDFFTLEGWNSMIIISERVKDLIMRKKLSNCVLVPVEDMRWPSNRVTPEEMLRLRESRETARVTEEVEKQFSKSGKFS
jgi:hypothetical protein